MNLNETITDLFKTHKVQAIHIASNPQGQIFMTVEQAVPHAGKVPENFSRVVHQIIGPSITEMLGTAQAVCVRADRISGMKPDLKIA